MSTVDPIATLLADLDRPVAPREEFASALLSRLLVVLDAESARPRRLALTVGSPALAPKRLRIALIVFILLLLVAAVATATYVAIHSASPSAKERQVRNGPLTLIAFDRIVTLSVSGERRTIWSCKSRDSRACGTPTSFAWSPEGRRLAVAVAQWNRESAVEGIDIIDLAVGKSVHVPREKLGCREQYDLAWSPTASGSPTPAQARCST